MSNKVCDALHVCGIWMVLETVLPPAIVGPSVVSSTLPAIGMYKGGFWAAFSTACNNDRAVRSAGTYSEVVIADDHLQGLIPARFC